jgi:hypothetical protein
MMSVENVWLARDVVVCVFGYEIGSAGPQQVIESYSVYLAP